MISEGKEIPMYEYEKNLEEEAEEVIEETPSTPELQGLGEMPTLALPFTTTRKPAKAKEDIDYIRKTVEEQLQSVNFLKAIKEKNEEKNIKNLLVRLITNWLEFRYNQSELFACPCMQPVNRILLALTIINDAQQTFKDRNQKIVYTSLASGSLLQDWLILKELISEFNNIEVNLIDIGYLSPAEYQKLAREKKITELEQMMLDALLQTEASTRLQWIPAANNRAWNHINFINDYLFNTSGNAITKFKELITQIAPHTNIRIFDSAYEYIRRLSLIAEKPNIDERTNILLLTDPNVGFFGIESYPRDANVLIFWDNNPNPPFIIFMPHHGPAQLLQLRLTLKNSTINNIKCALIDILLKTGADKKYTPKLVQELLSNSYIEKYIQQVKDEELSQKLAEAKLLVIREIAKSFPELLKAKPEELGKTTKEEDEEEEEISTGLTLPASFELLELNNSKILLSFGSDAYISFQDLIIESLAPQNLVYTLDTKDQTIQSKNDDVVTKINTTEYKKIDIVTFKSNRTYTTGKLFGDYSKNMHYNTIPIKLCSPSKK